MDISLRLLENSNAKCLKYLCGKEMTENETCIRSKSN